MAWGPSTHDYCSNGDVSATVQDKIVHRMQADIKGKWH